MKQKLIINIHNRQDKLFGIILIECYGKIIIMALRLEEQKMLDSAYHLTLNIQIKKLLQLF